MSILVTRPEPGATTTARKLAAMGYLPVILPLTEVKAIEVAAGVLPKRVDAVVATSANAARHCPKELVAQFADVRFFAVGDQTGAAARAAGFRSVENGPGTATALASNLRDRLDPGAVILFLCGRVRLNDFESALNATGIIVCAVETYDTVSLQADARIETLSVSGAIDGVLLYSAMAAQQFETLPERLSLRNVLAETTRFCLSQRIASQLTGVDGVAVHVATEPDEDALLALLVIRLPAQSKPAA